MSSTLYVCMLSHVQLFGTPWTVVRQAPLAMGFFRLKYWSGLPFPSPGELLNPGTEPASSSLEDIIFTTEPPGKSNCIISSVQSLSHVWLFAIPWTAGFPVHHQLQEFTQTHVHRVSDAIQPSHPLLSPSPPAPIPPSIRVFSNELTLHIRWSKYWNFSFSISPSNEYSRLISFRIDWFHLLAVQERLKSLLQHQLFLLMQF